MAIYVDLKRKLALRLIGNNKFRNPWEGGKNNAKFRKNERLGFLLGLLFSVNVRLTLCWTQPARFSEIRNRVYYRKQN